MVASAGAGLWWLRRPLPRTKGILQTDGVDSPVEILRDRHDMVHVLARSMSDAAFSMGLIHAQERLWQLEITRRVAYGRVSELVGDEGLLADRFMRRLGLRRVAGEEEKQLSLESQQMLAAYAAGINAVVSSSRPLPVEFQFLKLKPQPWHPIDSLACFKLLAVGLSMNWDAELQRLELLKAIGAEKASQLDIVYPETNPTILAETVAATSGSAENLAAAFTEASRWIPGVGGGSNAWVISGEKSATGRPILCNDPHLMPSVPAFWFAAHVVAGDDFASSGVTFPGLPFPMIGHNRRLAWGFTNSFADCQDLVIEEFDSPAHLRYRTENGLETSRIMREVIAVRGGDDVVEEVVITRHGPVMQRIDDPASGTWRGLALQWTSLIPGRSAETLLELQRVGDWAGFKQAFAGYNGPSQNIIYADIDGNIGYLLCGQIPVRNRPPAGLPVPGWYGDALWQKFLTPDEVPQTLNPSDGVLITANNRVVGDKFPHYIGSDYMNGYRASRIGQLLAGENLTLSDMREIQMDLLCIPALEVAKLLGKLPSLGKAMERWRRLLAEWDGVMSPDQIAPTVYEAFMRRLTENALRPSCGDAWSIVAGTSLSHPVFDYPANLLGRITPFILQRWRSDDRSLLGGAAWDDVAVNALRDAISDLRRLYGSPRRWAWGDVHQLRLQHRFGQRRPLGLLFSAERVKLGGNMDTVCATGDWPGKSLATTLVAPSWRQVLDVGAWDNCTGILYPGQSGHRGSRHRKDLLSPWRRNRQISLFWSDAAVRRTARHRFLLKPKLAAGEALGSEAKEAA